MVFVFIFSFFVTIDPEIPASIIVDSSEQEKANPDETSEDSHS
jgi:hypothetical protein